jgi:hypothetical protein
MRQLQERRICFNLIGSDSRDIFDLICDSPGAALTRANIAGNLAATIIWRMTWLRAARNRRISISAWGSPLLMIMHQAHVCSLLST